MILLQVEHAETWLARLTDAVAAMRRFDAAAQGGLAPMEMDGSAAAEGSAVGGAPPRMAALLDALEALREVKPWMLNLRGCKLAWVGCRRGERAFAVALPAGSPGGRKALVRGGGHNPSCEEKVGGGHKMALVYEH